MFIHKINFMFDFILLSSNQNIDKRSCQWKWDNE